MPPDGRCGADDDDRLARSRMPENGDAVGGPRGAGPSMDDADEVLPGWGGEGGGMLREAKEGGAVGGSMGPGGYCGGLPAAPPSEWRREGS